MIGKQFNLDEENIPQSVIDAGKTEATEIILSQYTRKQALSGRHRTSEEITACTVLGKVGEYLLKKHFNYSEDTNKWHDLVSSDGRRTEVKTWVNYYPDTDSIDRKVEQELKRLRTKRAMKPAWYFSTDLVVLIYDKFKKTVLVYGEYKI